MTKTGKIAHMGIGAMAALTAGMAANMAVASQRGHIAENDQYVGPLPNGRCTRCGGTSFELRNEFWCCASCGVSYGREHPFGFGNADPEIEALLRDPPRSNRPKPKFRHNRRG